MTIRLRGVCFFRRKPGKSRVYYKVTTYLRCASRLSHARYRNSRYCADTAGRIHVMLTVVPKGR